MAYLDVEEVCEAYALACEDAEQWRKDYPEYERLADNGLLDDLDENLPEVNDGSLAASLFKLAKRVIKKKMAGRAVALDVNDAWITELANIYWVKKILPNAKSKGTPRRKWKDAARKAAIFGGQPIVTLMVSRGNYDGADFIVPYALDVKLEAYKDSDEDSDIMFWDVYYSKLQLRNMLEDAKEEMEQAKIDKEQWQLAKAEAEAAGEPFDDDIPEPYNLWDLELLQTLIDSEDQESRPGNELPREEKAKAAKRSGTHLYVAVQRGVNAPFMLIDPNTDKPVRQWSNPDPTGDPGIRYLYCYQDFVNPYGVGIVKLAGGTQNVLDYMRQADILATQIGIRPPKMIEGDEDEVDEDSLVYAQDANWYVGGAKVTRMEMSNGVYNQLPERISMYQTSLQKFIPMGDTTISGTNSGDPQYSKTPAGIKAQANSLSIDDEDFSENVDECYAAVAKSMINVHFANMQADELLKLTGDEAELLQNSGLVMELDEEGKPSTDLQIQWDKMRASFDFELDPEADDELDAEQSLEGKLKAYELITADPNTDAMLAMDGKRVNRGELYGEIIKQLTQNDKIVVDMTSEEKQQMQTQQEEQAAMEAEAMAAEAQGGMQPPDPNSITPEEETAGQEIAQVMELYGVDEQTAAYMLEADRQGFEPEEILESLSRMTGQPSLEAANA